MSIRHDWYQSDSKVVITVLLKNASEKNYVVDIERQKIRMTADGYELELALRQPIVVERSTHKAFPSKVEITLTKESSERWDSLEQKDALPAAVAASIPPPTLHSRNWDSVAKEAEEAEEKDAKGDEALNRLFKKIYSNAKPEVQMAMNKSFTESGGTVLSTDWKEVSKDKVVVKPPDGTEFHKWDN